MTEKIYIEDFSQGESIESLLNSKKGKHYHLGNARNSGELSDVIELKYACIEMARDFCETIDSARIYEKDRSNREEVHKNLDLATPTYSTQAIFYGGKFFGLASIVGDMRDFYQLSSLINYDTTCMDSNHPWPSSPDVKSVAETMYSRCVENGIEVRNDHHKKRGNINPEGYGFKKRNPDDYKRGGDFNKGIDTSK